LNLANPSKGAPISEIINLLDVSPAFLSIKANKEDL